jgi:hypothetical protein
MGTEDWGMERIGLGETAVAVNLFYVLPNNRRSVLTGAR